ncbi:MAG: NADP-dependent oxidoreductase [Candidatus Obscuribacterales bacterium]|nr:NADP-dependent oxidoreductase [Candidatus Obscuribacterales bacterium]
MLRVQYRRYGGPAVMELAEFKQIEPGHSQIRVTVKAASANPVDWKIRNGSAQVLTGWKFPRGMGMDFAGTVEAVGSGVTQFKAGDEVFGAMEMRDCATFADSLVTGIKSTALKPQSLSFENAAALPVVGATAWIGLVEKAELKAGQSIFVAGCMGGVGRAVVQIARSFGANVAGSCSASNFDEARKLGVSTVVDYRNFDAGGFRGKFDLVYDTHGDLSLKQCRDMLNSGGVVIHIAPDILTMSAILLSAKHQLVFGQPTPEILEKLGTLAVDGRLVSAIGKVVGLCEAISALTELEKSGTPKGKLIITP